MQFTGIHALPPGLPTGRLVVPASAEDGQIYTDPVLWVSEEPQAAAGDLWASLLEQRAETGLWPLLLLGVYVGKRVREMVPEELVRGRTHRPWHVGELEPVPAEGIADVDVGRVLARWWREVVTGTGEEAFDFGEEALPEVPFRDWPGIVTLSGAGSDPDLTASRIVKSPERLRELERFGARVCVLGINRLVMTVARPPETFDEARRVAAEHLAFRKAFENNFDEYARGLIGDQVWFFWWD